MNRRATPELECDFKNPDVGSLKHCRIHQFYLSLFWNLKGFRSSNAACSCLLRTSGFSLTPSIYRGDLIINRTLNTPLRGIDEDQSATGIKNNLESRQNKLFLTSGPGGGLELPWRSGSTVSLNANTACV